MRTPSNTGGRGKLRLTLEVLPTRSSILLRERTRDPRRAANPVEDLLDFGLDGSEELDAGGA